MTVAQALACEVAQASACELGPEKATSTGIRPSFRLIHQTCAYRIPLNVRLHLFQLLWISDPVVKRLVLPEWFSGALKNRVGLTCGPPFNCPGDLGQIDSGRDQDVHVVGHNHESVQLMLAAGAFPETVQNASSHFRLTQPSGAAGSSIQQPILLNKCAPISAAFGESGKRTRQAPRDKDGCARRMPVGKVAPVHSTNEVGCRRGYSHIGISQAEQAPEKGLHRLKPVPRGTGFSLWSLRKQKIGAPE